jgi:magnesium chelatase subunit D
MEPLSPWDRVTLALTVLAIDPSGIKGLWLRARAGAVRDHVTAALPSARRLHPNIDDNALFGGIDLTATLSAGRVVTSPGLLDTPTTLILTMAERCPPGLAARLARTLDDPGFSLIALDEGAEPDETLPPALTDRLGLFLDLTDIAWSESAPLELTRLATARAALPHVQTPPDAIATLTRVAHALTIDSLRAPLLALACARALAAWNGHPTITEEDLQRATELTLAHRGEVLPTAEDAPPEDTPPPEDPDDPQSQNDNDTIPDDILLAAARAALPADLLAKLAAGRAARAAKGSGGTGAARKGNHRGRPLPSRPGKPGSGKRIDLIGTLRAAAPWQPLRRRGPATETLRIEIRPDDIRLKRYNETSDRLLIFAVDASGSSALARLAEAKGAVELLLAQAYARRDHVALVAFRGTAADLVLPPTRSLVQTKRRLAGLPGGGGTPLAAGLKMAFDLALQSRARGLTPTVALLTDGRGNIALDGTANRAMAEADSLRLARTLRASGIPAMVIDIANRPQPALRQLADLLDAPYLALPRADARKLSAALSLALGD